MDIPEIWLYFGNSIHQDFMFDFPDLISGFVYIITDFSPEQTIQLHDFLLELKKLPLDNRQLSNIWEQSGTQILIGEKNTSLIFDELLKIVELQI